MWSVESLRQSIQLLRSFGWLEQWLAGFDSWRQTMNNWIVNGDFSQGSDGFAGWTVDPAYVSRELIGTQYYARLAEHSGSALFPALSQQVELAQGLHTLNFQTRWAVAQSTSASQTSVVDGPKMSVDVIIRDSTDRQVVQRYGFLVDIDPPLRHDSAQQCAVIAFVVQRAQVLTAAASVAHQTLAESFFVEMQFMAGVFGRPGMPVSVTDLELRAAGRSRLATAPLSLWRRLFSPHPTAFAQRG